LKLWPFGGKDNKGDNDLPRPTDETEEFETEEFEGDDANDEETDDLADLDEEVKARVDKALAAREQTFQAQLRQREEALGELGMGFMADGRPAIRDPKKVASWAGVQDAALAPAPAARAEEEDEEIDVYDLDGKKLNQLVEKRAAKALEKALAPMQEMMREQQQLLRGYEARDAVSRAQEAVRTMAPHLDSFLEHPDFAAQFRQVAATVTPQQLQDPNVLLMLAGSAVTMLDPAKAQPRRSRTATGQYAADPAMQSTLARRGLASVAPSRDGGSGQTTRAQDEEARVALSRFLGEEISPERHRAAQYDNYDDWKAALTAKQKR
jgi:hypothetical protein